MVNAFFPEYTEKTLAARPVGAKRAVFFQYPVKVLTKALTKVVFPVPAYPFNRNSCPGSFLYKKSVIFSMAMCCPSVGI